jgi:hypothetical protein
VEDSVRHLCFAGFAFRHYSAAEPNGPLHSSVETISYENEMRKPNVTYVSELTSVQWRVNCSVVMAVPGFVPTLMIELSTLFDGLSV